MTKGLVDRHRGGDPLVNPRHHDHQARFTPTRYNLRGRRGTKICSTSSGSFGNCDLMERGCKVANANSQLTDTQNQKRNENFKRGRRIIADFRKYIKRLLVVSNKQICSAMWMWQDGWMKEVNCRDLGSLKLISWWQGVAHKLSIIMQHPGRVLLKGPGGFIDWPLYWNIATCWTPLPWWGGSRGPPTRRKLPAGLRAEAEMRHLMSLLPDFVPKKEIPQNAKNGIFGRFWKSKKIPRASRCYWGKITTG